MSATMEIPVGSFSFRQLPGADYRLLSAYNERQRNSENERVKQPQRERVMAHILRYHPESAMRLFSLPGVYWEFEKQLMSQWSRHIKFVALDWSYGILELGQPHMPGGPPSKVCYPLKDGAVYGFKSECAKWVWAHASSFFHIGGSDQATKSCRRKWAQRFKNISAAWLDFTSPLCAETINTLRRFGSSCSEHQAPVPVAITLMLAREPNGVPFPQAHTVIESRARAVDQILNQNYFRCFERTDAWQYESTGGVPMGVICGLLKLRSSKK